MESPNISFPELDPGETIDDFLEGLASLPPPPGGDELFFFDFPEEPITPFVTQFGDALLNRGNRLFVAVKVDELGNSVGLAIALEY